jgi:hypothetical protein
MQYLCMKHLILIILIIASAQMSAGQKIRFTDTSNHWSELISIYNDGQGGTLLQSYQYIQDSTVGSTDYRIFEFGSDYQNGTNYLIREDTFLNKVYIWDGNSDVLLMDYNLNVGDTFSITYPDQFNQHRYAVLGLDSILINATWHKVWTYSQNLDGNFPNDNSILIEGIGCIRHPLYLLQMSNCVECSYFYMYCFSNNGTTPLVSPGQPYVNGYTMLFDNDTSCTVIPALTTNNLTHRPQSFELFPNPAHSLIRITSTDNIARIIITDVVGRVVHRQECNSKQAQVDITLWPGGIYFARINDTEITKFIKD